VIVKSSVKPGDMSVKKRILFYIKDTLRWLRH